MKTFKKMQIITSSIIAVGICLALAQSEKTEKRLTEVIEAKITSAIIVDGKIAIDYFVRNISKETLIIDKRIFFRPDFEAHFINPIGLPALMGGGSGSTETRRIVTELRSGEVLQGKRFIEKAASVLQNGKDVEIELSFHELVSLNIGGKELWADVRTPKFEMSKQKSSEPIRGN